MSEPSKKSSPSSDKPEHVLLYVERLRQDAEAFQRTVEEELRTARVDCMVSIQPGGLANRKAMVPCATSCRLCNTDVTVGGLAMVLIIQLLIAVRGCR